MQFGTACTWRAPSPPPTRSWRPFYREFVPVHVESWKRTGMQPHPFEYWTALARTVLDGGGRDLVVVARDADGQALAGVTCHLRNGRALHWSGVTREPGLRSGQSALPSARRSRRVVELGSPTFRAAKVTARERKAKELAIMRYKAQFRGGLVRVGGFQTEPPVAAIITRRALRAVGGSAAARTSRRARDVGERQLSGVASVADTLALGTAQRDSPMASPTAPGSPTRTGRCCPRASLRLGVRYLDTAQDYGGSEEIIGRYLQHADSPTVAGVRVITEAVAGGCGYRRRRARSLPGGIVGAARRSADLGHAPARRGAA